MDQEPDRESKEPLFRPIPGAWPVTEPDLSDDQPERPLPNSEIQTYVKRLRAWKIPRGKDSHQCIVFRAMLKFERFTQDLCDALETEADEGTLTKIVSVHQLRLIYENLPDYATFWPLHNWVKEFMWYKHLHRLSLQQRYFLAVITGEGAVTKRLHKALSQARSWYEDVLAVESLVVDPDETALFTAHLKEIKLHDENRPKPGDTCPICYEAFVLPVTGNQHLEDPQMAFCGHIFCKECISQWCTEQSSMKGHANCPLCRKCIACGDIGCKIHWIDPKEMNPAPLLPWIRAVIGPGEGPLNGLTPERFWQLRERTRGVRAKLARLESDLGRIEGYNEIERWGRRFDDAYLELLYNLHSAYAAD